MSIIYQKKRKNMLNMTCYLKMKIKPLKMCHYFNLSKPGKIQNTTTDMGKTSILVYYQQYVNC